MRLHTPLLGRNERRRRPHSAASQIEVKDSGICELDFFVGRTTNPDFERRLCQRLKTAIERPIEVTVTGKGVDAVTTELCVTAPWDAGGHARPRVLLDVTHALRQLGIMVFKADIHTARIPGRPLQEIHRFLLTDSHGQPIDDPLMRDKVVKKARRGAGRAACVLLRGCSFR